MALSFLCCSVTYALPPPIINPNPRNLRWLFSHKKNNIIGHSYLAPSILGSCFRLIPHDPLIEKPNPRHFAAPGAYVFFFVFFLLVLICLLVFAVRTRRTYNNCLAESHHNILADYVYVSCNIYLFILY